MEIDWARFTPWQALAGGLLIGTAASILWLRNRRIAGVSGILGAMLERGGLHSWRVAFVAGLVLAPLVFQPLLSRIPLSAPRMPGGEGTTLFLQLLAGGFLVGLGTRIGGGCTSGSRRVRTGPAVPRSLVAVPVFMATGFLTVFLWRLAGGLGA
ncbi:MAG: YeeE/YedE family protein [Gammaproteobacteria bacterium]|nr:YeeE/YedE family protein [Gammaproteobacteria bacterium]